MPFTNESNKIYVGIRINKNLYMKLKKISMEKDFSIDDLINYYSIIGLLSAE